MKINCRLLFVVLVLTFVGCGKEKWEWRTDKGEVYKVSLKTIEEKGSNAVKVFGCCERDLVNKINATGSILAAQKTVLSSKISAQVLEVGVEEGAKVEKGNLLALLEGSQTKIKLEEVRKRSERTQSEYKRMKDLYDEGGVTVSQLEDVEVRLNRSKAEAKQLEEEYLKTKIYAPFTGTIVRRMTNPSEVVTTGQPLFELVDMDRVKIRVSISEVDITEIKSNQEAIICVDAYPDEKFIGRVEYIAATADSITRMFPIEVYISNPQERLKIGMSARMEIITSLHEKCLVVPQEAVLREENEVFVFVISNLRAHKTGIVTGIKSDNWQEVTSGLHPGDLVVVEGQYFLKDGGYVEIIEGE